MLQNANVIPSLCFILISYRLYVFRNMPYFKIMVCGGDGTVGWALGCLDNVCQDARCQSPPMAIIPLGTGKVGISTVKPDKNTNFLVTRALNIAYLGSACMSAIQFQK